MHASSLRPAQVGVIGSGKGMTQYNKLRRVDGMGDGGEDA